jgi:fatty-acyl-CoA synthase
LPKRPIGEPGRRRYNQGMTHTLTNLISQHATANPQGIALIDRNKTWTYAGLLEASQRLATGLSQIGISAGDRVAFWLPNIAEYLALHLACGRLGAITVSVNTRFRSSEVGDIVGRSGAKALILWPTFKDIAFLDILGDVPAADLAALEHFIIYDEGEDMPALTEALQHINQVPYKALAASAPAEFDHATEDGGTIIFTTSGTTAAPKFVLHSQFSIVAHARNVAGFFGWDADDTVLLQALPLCGTFGHAQAMAGLASGRPMISMPVFSGKQAAAIMRKHKVTNFNGSDEMFSLILDEGEGERPYPLFKFGGYAAFNPAFAGILERANDKGMPLCGLWGMSEMQALYSLQDPEADVETRLRAGGRTTSPLALVRVRDPESGNILPHGEAGEIEASGPSQMTEYFGDPAATAKALTDDGYVRTGDLGYTTSDTSFVFLSRMGDVLRLGGFLVNPAEIESHLESHAAVGEAQVVGVDTDTGTRAYAFVIPVPGSDFDAAGVLAWCTDGMAKFKVPMAISVLDAFPTTDSANGVKIQRKKLREMAMDNLEGS